MEVTVKIKEKEAKKPQGPKKTKKPTGRPLKCAYCGGTGRDPVIPGTHCTVCGGTGRVPPDRKKKCVYCKNTGRDPVIPGTHCTKCGGWGYIK